MLRFTTETMMQIIDTLSHSLASQTDLPLEFELQTSPPQCDGYPGDIISTEYGPLRYRTLQNLVDLAEVLGCQLFQTGQTGPWTRFQICPTPRVDKWHGADSDTEKYGTSSPYQRIQKLEDPRFYSDLHRCLKETQIQQCRRLISLGVNTGDELAPVNQLNPTAHCVGIDHCASAITVARERHRSFNHEFIEMDLNRIEEIDKRHFHNYDVLMSLGTLHSPGVDSKRVFMWCMQHLLAKGASVIIGFPNCRWANGHPTYGARTRNRREMDMSLVIKDVYFVKKYLQQHRFNVTIFGKYYLFVVGTPICHQ